MANGHLNRMSRHERHAMAPSKAVRRLGQSSDDGNDQGGRTSPMRDEVRPPGWAVSGAERLDLEEFGRTFITHWRQARSGLVKFECWQTYEEPDTKSLHEYQRGNFAAVEELLETEADLDQEGYDD